ncbi:MAG: aminoacyl-tRNA hydrolase [Deltaproteobacteria bacterium]|nr:MAG: aminoacyl-tRNA hydrolase [Deltaproteobacteria bacterium]
MSKRSRKKQKLRRNRPQPRKKKAQRKKNKGSCCYFYRVKPVAVPPMKLIVGLGNPGRRYRLNRHNLGFRAIDHIAETSSIRIKVKKFRALIGEGRIMDEEAILAKPQTYMNLSGVAVEALKGFYRIGLSDVILINDDFDLNFGRIRIKQRGGDGGHLGLRSVIEHLGDDRFLRIRLGVGRPVTDQEATEYVLSNFSREEEETLPKFLDIAEKAVKALIGCGVQKAMNEFNSLAIS